MTPGYRGVATSDGGQTCADMAKAGQGQSDPATPPPADGSGHPGVSSVARPRGVEPLHAARDVHAALDAARVRYVSLPYASSNSPLAIELALLCRLARARAALEPDTGGAAGAIDTATADRVGALVAELAEVRTDKRADAARAHTIARQLERIEPETPGAVSGLAAASREKLVRFRDAVLRHLERPGALHDNAATSKLLRALASLARCAPWVLDARQP